ncbi:MAG TPA: hypothetical protein VIF09_02375 [Polyangiaceae bacterium]
MTPAGNPLIVILAWSVGGASTQVFAAVGAVLPLVGRSTGGRDGDDLRRSRGGAGDGREGARLALRHLSQAEAGALDDGTAVVDVRVGDRLHVALELLQLHDEGRPQLVARRRRALGAGEDGVLGGLQVVDGLRQLRHGRGGRLEARVAGDRLSTCCAKLMSAGTLLSGRLSTASERRTVFEGVVMRMRLLVVGIALTFTRARVRESRMAHGNGRRLLWLLLLPLSFVRAHHWKRPGIDWVFRIVLRDIRERHRDSRNADRELWARLSYEPVRRPDDRDTRSFQRVIRTSKPVVHRGIRERAPDIQKRHPDDRVRDWTGRKRTRAARERESSRRHIAPFVRVRVSFEPVRLSAIPLTHSVERALLPTKRVSARTVPVHVPLE